MTAPALIVVERPMYFNYNGVWSGGHDVVGAKAPSTTYYFAEGYTGSTFEEYLCLFNPGSTSASATITFMITNPDGTSQTQTISRTIPKTSRITENVKSLVGADKNVSIKVTSNYGIVAERPMYFNYNGAWSGGHDVVGFVP